MYCLWDLNKYIYFKSYHVNEHSFHSATGINSFSTFVTIEIDLLFMYVNWYLFRQCIQSFLCYTILYILENEILCLPYISFTDRVRTDLASLDKDPTKGTLHEVIHTIPL